MYHLEFLLYINNDQCQMDYVTIHLNSQIHYMIKDYLNRSTGLVSKDCPDLFLILDEYGGLKDVGSIVYCFLRKNVDVPRCFDF